LLKKQWQFGDYTFAKYLLAIWCYFTAKCTRGIWQHPVAKHMPAILAISYCLNRNNKVSSFIRLEGVNYVFSHVSLILVATFLF
jgi:hypothetical protein